MYHQVLNYPVFLCPALQESYGIIMHSIQFLVMKNPPVENKDLHHANANTAHLFPDMDRPDYSALPRKIALQVTDDETRNIVVFNPDSRRRHEVVSRSLFSHPCLSPLFEIIIYLLDLRFAKPYYFCRGITRFLVECKHETYLFYIARYPSAHANTKRM